MNFAKPPVISDSLTNEFSRGSSLTPTIGASAALTNPLLQASWQGASSAIAFIDANVTDYQALTAGIVPGTEIHILDSSQDAVTQITNTLLGRHDISSLHIVSHGEAGGLDFGTGRLNLSDLPEYAAQLQSWSNALTDDADILLYGCNVAEGELGKAFTSILSQLTGADVAASDDLTGSSALGGDWELEFNTGTIESSLAFQSSVLANYQAILPIGPDGSGYIAASTNLQAIDLVAGVAGAVDIGLVGDDPAAIAINLGTSTFRFYGTNYTGANQLFVNANALITFGSGIPDYTNTDFTSATPTQAAIGVAWDDWRADNGGSVLYQFRDLDSNGTNDQLIIEWSTVPHYSNIAAGNATFQAILELNTGLSNGNIILNYPDLSIVNTPVDEAGSATVAIKAAGTQGINRLLVSQDTTDSPYVGTGKAVLITGRTPVLDLSGDVSQSAGGVNYNVVFNQGEGAVTLVDSNFGLLDSDSSSLASAAVTLTNRPNGALESLAAVTTGTNITASYNSTNGVLTLNGSDTVANYRQVIGSITYNNTNGNPNATIRTVTFTVSDGTNTSPIATTTIGINAPKIDLNGPASGINYTAYRPGTTAVSIVSTTSLTVTDVNNATLASATVSITNVRNSPSEILAATTTGTSIVASYNSASGVLTLSGSDTLANYQQVLRTVTYNNSASSPDTRDRLINFTVNDGVNTSPIATSILNYGTPPAPTISTNTLTISESGTVVLSSSNLNATDADSTPAELTYTATTVTRGRFELVSAPGVAVTSFTQAQINAGQVQFVHDGSETAPTYAIRVSDGTTNSGTSTVTIPGGGFTNINDTPIVSTNTLSINEGGSVVLSSSNLNTTDPDNTAAQLTYTASAVTNGQFELVSAPGTAITTFTQNQINTSQIRFVHNGSEAAPTYTFTVSDGAKISTPNTVTIPGGGFSNTNDAPSISINTLTLTEGGTTVLGSSNLNATDPDNNPTQLTYTATGVTNGRFELVSAPGTAITSFTQAQINAGAVQFVHDGSENAPTYALTVSDGSANSPSSSLTIPAGGFTGTNDAPTVSVNSLSLSEGGSVVLSSSNLNATDPDNTPDQLTYTTSGVTNGRFEFVSAPGTAITSFTQAQINAGAVQFIHDGSETAPTYSLSVSDGSANSTSSTVTIPAGGFTNTNDTPTVSTNTLTLTEGGTTVLGSSNLNATDPDNNPTQLTYTATGVTNGRFELVSAPGTAITSFTQAQINAGAVQFVHNGSESAPTYSLSVSDGSANSTSSSVTIPAGGFVGVNDAPTISTNTLSVNEGATVVLGNTNINAVDLDNTPTQLTYTATGVTNGRFELVSAPGVAISNFTQAQINAGAVQFVHNGSESAPTYSLSVSDGSANSTSSTVTIPAGGFVGVNDAPTISTNTLTVSEGSSLVLSSANLNTTDPDSTPSQLTYTVGGTPNGRFELVANPGVAITSFTQLQINNGQVRFVHDGSENPPAYSLTVGDGSLNSTASSVTIPVGGFVGVNDAPTISTNTISISEGGSLVLGSSNLNTADPDNNPTQLTYTATGVTNGRFELVANPGAAITSFTQAQINSGQVQFVQDGSENAPTYSLTVGDGTANSSASTVTIPAGGFTNTNDAPTIATNTLSVSEGGSIVLNSSNINATDPDSNLTQLTYTVSGVTSGRFEAIANPGVAITSFTQLQINNGQVRFVHDGSETAPTYSLTVNDGTVSSASTTVTIPAGGFTNINDAPTVSTNTLSISEGATIVLGSTNLNTSDPDSNPTQLTYTVGGVTNGRFELVANPGTAVTTFTQAQVNAGQVQFVHDGSENAPTYSVSVGDGIVSSASSTLTIPSGGFTNTNDAPSISTNTLSIGEGGSVVLSSSNLNATDVDSPSDQLTYTATGVTNGRFELVANPGTAITTFTQAQINGGQVRFVQDGSETAPTYSLTVSDGSVSGTSSSVTIPSGGFTNTNDAPTISTNTLTVTEGGSVVLSSSNLNTTDPDNNATQLAYTATGVTSGRFELIANPGTAITTFTQAQINSGQVRFVHDGSETAPTYSLTVSDGSVGSTASSVTIPAGGFTGTNDAPTISANSLSIAEGGSVVLSSSNLNATDPDSSPTQLTYTVSGITNGRFEKVGIPGVAITSFTQAEINSGQVRFVHDGSEAAPTYSVTLSDGSVSSVSNTVTIPSGGFTNTNDAPSISSNSLSIAEGGSVILSSANLNTIDPDTNPAQLTYTASGVTNGRFELVSAPGTAITSFTQAQINSGAVRFVQDGSENAPAYSLTVSDGSAPSASNTVTIPSGGFTNTNDAPSISVNTISITEGGTLILSSSNLNAIDPDNASTQLTYNVSNVTNGRFEFVSAPGIAITSFTQAQINSGAVQFVHDGSETPPAYSLSLSDGSAASTPSTVTVPAGGLTSVNDAPTLSGNATLTAVTRNTTNPSGASLSSLFGSVFTDPDTGASLSGLAIVGNTANATTQGQWQYSLNGTTWTNVGAVAEGATALALSASTLVRFVPVTGYLGAPPSLSVRALDNTYGGGFSTGTAPVLVNTTTTGGSTAIAGGTPTALSTSVIPGLPNLVWRNSNSGENVVWSLSNFSLSTRYSIPSITDPAWQIASSAIDFNQDGNIDILWRNQVTGANTIWQMNNTGYQSTYFLDQVSDLNWQVATTADFNGDGKADILWRNAKTGENLVWQMNGTALQSKVFIQQAGDINWQVAGTADFNGDGKADILWRNAKTGENVVWQMNGTSLQSVSFLAQVGDTNWQIAGTADFNGDGKADILWRNKATGANIVWQMNGTALQSSTVLPEVLDLNWQIAGVADLGGTSAPEILWHHKQAGKEVIWQMNGFSYSQTYALPDVTASSWSVKPFVAASILAAN